MIWSTLALVRAVIDPGRTVCPCTGTLVSTAANAIMILSRPTISKSLLVSKHRCRSAFLVA